MESILISIKPKYVEKILNGEKTIEIRKNKPNIELPCKVYIYCTKGKPYLYRVNDDNEFELTNKLRFQDSSCFVKDYNAQNGKVVAEFTLNEIETLWQNNKNKTSTATVVDKAIFEKQTCITWEQYCEYHKCKNGKYSNSYAWHIEGLKIYDKPKELSEFSHYIPNNKYPKKECGIDCEDCMSYDGEHETCLALYYSHWQIKRPPQSWMFVESLGGEE